MGLGTKSVGHRAHGADCDGAKKVTPLLFHSFPPSSLTKSVLFDISNDFLIKNR